MRDFRRNRDDTMKRPGRRRPVAIGLFALLTLVACSSGGSMSLAALAEATFSSEVVWRGDDRYVTVTVTDSHMVSLPELETYLLDLGFSPAVYERMNRTRALDGTQSGTSEIANVTWTYHPDNGLQAVFEKEDGR